MDFQHFSATNPPTSAGKRRFMGLASSGPSGRRLRSQPPADSRALPADAARQRDPRADPRHGQDLMAKQNFELSTVLT